ncbi:hypothetical protein JJD41_20075 [Oxynema sp. CENA135]|uniref:hypothetical protein n=1 Tax=Oxynema sp. CENA135 TaxID=984206 RepID=UPI00190A9454|nr:hypothetical protein [Oxynema sp. CENA135]MBK4732147.1 hypothetical protein [Oxynema sp. CENA135]
MLGDADLEEGQSLAAQIGSGVRRVWWTEFSAAGGVERCRAIAWGSDRRVLIALEGISGDPDGMRGRGTRQ